MRYIIMCGGIYPQPRALFEVNGEVIIERTIRLLRSEGVEDIAISSRDPIYEKYALPVLVHDNNFNAITGEGYWVDAFYPMDEPACYLFGDVYFSEAAVHKIVVAQTDDVEFFASAPPFAENYPKTWAEPFAFKVVNQEHFRQCIKTVKQRCDQGLYKRHPIAWELWQTIKNTPINFIDFSNYTAINDYSCDVDVDEQLEQWRNMK